MWLDRTFRTFQHVLITRDEGPDVYGLRDGLPVSVPANVVGLSG